MTKQVRLLQSQNPMTGPLTAILQIGDVIASPSDEYTYRPDGSDYSSIIIMCIDGTTGNDQVFFGKFAMISVSAGESVRLMCS